MRQLYILVLLLALGFGQGAQAMPHKLYVFEDDIIRRITVRFENDSTVFVANIEDRRHRGRPCFTDEYRYAWIDKSHIRLRLVSTNRVDSSINKKVVLPCRLYRDRDFNYSSQLFNLLSGETVEFSEDYSRMRIGAFLFESKEEASWLYCTNLISPLLYLRLGLGIFIGQTYNGQTYCFRDRQERNMTIKFIDEETIQVVNIDSINGDYSFVDTYRVKPDKKNLRRYKVTKLVSTTRCDRGGGVPIPPLGHGKISSCGDVFPILKNETIYFDTVYVLLQIGQFPFKYQGELIPCG